MRDQFPERRRRNAPVRDDKNAAFNIDPPAELPRTIELPAWQKAVPWVVGVAVIGIVIMLVLTGVRLINPIYLVFMAMMAFGVISSFQNAGGASEMTTPQVNSERSEYLRYLSGTAQKIRAAADTQRASAEWSHPDPDVLEAHIGSARMWERGSADLDYLKIRVGRDNVKLARMIKVKPVDNELDLEPVAKTALQHMRAVQQSVRHCPKAIDFVGVGHIAFYGDRAMFCSALRAWICQLVCWHAPTSAVVAVVSPDLESTWDWTKWLHHTESPDIDGVGPARYLARSLRDVEAMLAPLLKGRTELVTTSGGRERVGSAEASTTHKHVVLVVDDPAADPMVVKRIASLDGVTVITYRDTGGPDRDCVPHGRELLLHLSRDDAGAARMRSWKNFHWELFCEEPDLMAPPVARHLARRMSRWDAAPTAHQDRESASANTMLSLLGIPNACKLDVDALWALRTLDEQLRVPLGLMPDGAPLWIDLKDEADGGNGPHGLIIGMTGSGKSKLLKALVFGLLVRHSPDVVQVILADWKDEAGFDEFANYPQTVAVISNMEEKRSLVERFGDTLFGLLDRRGRIFKETGTKIKGAAFEKLSEYNAARDEQIRDGVPEDDVLPPMPTLYVIVDEFSLMLKDQRDMAEVFDTITRKGRSLGMFFLFASQTLDEGTIKKIPENTQYRLGLKVASPSISRRVIGNEEAYHIPAGKNFKGTGFFVKAPGAEPVKFRSFLLPDRYEPPVMITRQVITAEPRARLFTAGRVEPDPDTVIETEVAAETAIAGPPRSLVLTVGPQLAAAWGKPGDQLWSPPLDDPIPLDAVLAAASTHTWRSTTPWWPLGEVDQPRLLTHSLLRYGIDSGNAMILGAPQTGRSTAVQTFILSAASRYSPRDIGFYALGYGGPELAAVKDLPHMGAIGDEDHKELTLRIFGDLDAVIAGRRRMHAQHGVTSTAEYRLRRSQGDPLLDDGYPTDIFLIVDGWERFLADNTSVMNPKNPLAKTVERLADASSYGIHVVVTAADWITLGQGLQSKVTCRWELKLAQNSASLVRPRLEDKMMRPQDRIPVDQPGRGINSSGEVIRFAVGRTDGAASTEDLEIKVRDTVAQISGHHAAVRRMPSPPLLPLSIDSGDLGQDDLAGERFALGVRSRDLRPLVIDFAEDPLLAAYADSRKGKTSLIRHLTRSVVERRSSPEQILVCVFDINRRMMDLTHLLAEGEDLYETDPASMAVRALQLAQVLEARTPPQNLTWEQKRNWTFNGPTIYLFVDDLDAIPAQVLVTAKHLLNYGAITDDEASKRLPSQQMPVWAPLVPYLASARDNGLRVIMTHKAVGAQTAEIHPNTLPGQIHTQRSNRILLSSRTTSDKVGGVKFEDGLPPGRGFMIATAQDNEGYVQLAATDPIVLQRG